MPFEEQETPLSYRGSMSEHGQPEQPTTAEAKRQKPSVLEQWMSNDDLPIEEKDLEGEAQQFGVAINNGQTLIIDRKTRVEQEIKLITEFIEAARNGENLGWFFDEDGPAFIEVLIQVLEARKQALESGSAEADSTFFDTIPDILKSRDFGPSMVSKIKAAAELFKNKAVKETIRRAIAIQINFLPFESFELVNGREVAFSAKNLFDEDTPFGDPGLLDWIFVNALDGTPELVISSQYGISYVNGFGNSMEEFVKLGKFSFKVADSGSQRKVDDDIILTLEQGGAPTEPIFTRIRIVKKPISLDREVQSYIEDDEKREREREDRYQSTPPQPSHRAQQAPRSFVSSG